MVKQTSNEQGGMETTNSRERILAVSEKLFAEKGFDAARVDEIAEKAGINKALIYYYFKSKEEILHVLFHKLLDEMMCNQDILDIEKTMTSEETVKELFLNTLLTLEPRKDLLRIFLMETLKGSKDHLLSDKFFHFIMRYYKEAHTQVGKELKDPQEFLVLDFFTAVMPIVSYVVFKDMWCRQFNISEEELRDKFIKIFLKTHVAYTREVLYSRKKD